MGVQMKYIGNFNEFYKRPDEYHKWWDDLIEIDFNIASQENISLEGEQLVKNSNSQTHETNGDMESSAGETEGSTQVLEPLQEREEQQLLNDQ